MDYAKYLRSKLWRHIRTNVFRRDRRKCLSCGCKAEVVHHGSYDSDTMAGRDLRRLYSMCGACHDALTFDAVGLKRPQSEVAILSREMRIMDKAERVASIHRIKEKRLRPSKTGALGAPPGQPRLAAR